MTNNKTKKSSEMNGLKKENKDLKRELRRKEKALAEAAALLILQKKSQRDVGQQQRRGRLTMSSDREDIIGHIKEACQSGARQVNDLNNWWF